MTIFSYPQASITNTSESCSSDWLWIMWYLLFGCLNFSFKNGSTKAVSLPLDSSLGQHFDISGELYLGLCFDLGMVVEWVWLLQAANLFKTQDV